MVTDFSRTYVVDTEGRLYAIDSWCTPSGERVESRTTDIAEEDIQIYQVEIDMAFMDRENEQAANRHRTTRGRA